MQYRPQFLPLWSGFSAVKWLLHIQESSANFIPTSSCSANSLIVTSAWIYSTWFLASDCSPHLPCMPAMGCCIFLRWNFPHFLRPSASMWTSVAITEYEQRNNRTQVVKALTMEKKPWYKKNNGEFSGIARLEIMWQNWGYLTDIWHCWHSACKLMS